MESSGAMYATVDSAAAQKAARRRPTQSPVPTENVGTTAAASVAASTHAAEPAVQAWAASLASHATCNPEQRAFCLKVADRVTEELREARGDEATTEPLRWVLHGGPGTGKSYTLKMLRKELFEGVLMVAAWDRLSDRQLPGGHGRAAGWGHHPSRVGPRLGRRQHTK